MLAISEAIVLRSKKQGDTSKIVTLYTKEYGLIDVIAKGARQQKSKFGSALEPFTLSKIVFYKKEHTSLYLLSAAEIISAHRNLMNDLEHIESATQIAELLIRSQHHEEQQTELFELVRLTIDILNRSPDPDSAASVVIAFFLRYAEFSGFALQVQSEYGAGMLYFDCESGEIFASTSTDASTSMRYVAISAAMLPSLEYLRNHTIEESAVLRLSEPVKKGLDLLFKCYFAFHIEGMQHGRPKAARVFASLK